MTGDPKFTAQATFVILVIGACVWVVGTLLGPIGWFLGAGIGLTAFYAIVFTITDKEYRRRDTESGAAGEASSSQHTPTERS